MELRVALAVALALTLTLGGAPTTHAQYNDVGAEPGPFDSFPSPFQGGEEPNAYDTPAVSSGRRDAYRPEETQPDAYADDRFRAPRDDYRDPRDDADYDDRDYDDYDDRDERQPRRARRHDDYDERDDRSHRARGDDRDAPRFMERSEAPAAQSIQSDPVYMEQSAQSVPHPLVAQAAVPLVQDMRLTSVSSSPPSSGSDFRFKSSLESGAGTVAVAAAGAGASASATQMTTAEVAEDDDDDGPKDPLDAPLEEIKRDIISKSKQIKEELNWITQVEDVIKKYTAKIENVQSNVGILRQEVKELLKKKRQVQNLKLQKKLQQKLEDASADMGTISTALNHVKTKENNFQRTKKNLGQTIGSLKTALAALKGMTLSQLEAEERGEDPNSVPADGAEGAPAEGAEAADGAATLAMLLQKSATTLGSASSFSQPSASTADAVAAATKALSALKGISSRDRGSVDAEAAADPQMSNMMTQLDDAVPHVSVGRALLALRRRRANAASVAL